MLHPSLRFALCTALIVLLMGSAQGVKAQQTTNNSGPALPHTVSVGVTGFANKRPVFAGACIKQGCPWGELAEFTHDVLAPLGYDVVVCENCNRTYGPGLVSAHAYAPPLEPEEMALGITSRVNARVDFGITNNVILDLAYAGYAMYHDSPTKNLRLIATIEDPYYVLVAVRASLGITSLQQIKERKLRVRMIADGLVSPDILKYYGMTAKDIVDWGGSVRPAIGAPDNAPFDVVISEFGAATNNPEAAIWSRAAQTANLRFLPLPAPLLDHFVEKGGMMRVVARCCMLRGFTAPIPTVGWTGDAIFGRDDMPDDAAYDIAKAVDQHHGDLIWFVRPYSYDPATVWKDALVPLHPGAARYYQEKGYMPAAPR